MVGAEIIFHVWLNINRILLGILLYFCDENVFFNADVSFHLGMFDCGLFYSIGILRIIYKRIGFTVVTDALFIFWHFRNAKNLTSLLSSLK